MRIRMSRTPCSFDWTRARSYLAAAEGGSYSAAARRLGLTQPTVGRQVAALEAELGVTLFERIATGVELTEAGIDLLEPVRAMAAAAESVSLAAAGASGSLEGLVRITASEAISAFLLPVVVRRLRREHPGIELELVATNHLQDLRRREADLAIRNVAPDDPELIARRLPTAEGHFYATPDYLASIGDPSTPEQLAAADFISFSEREAMLAWINSVGVPSTLAGLPIFSANHLVQWSMCCEGLGVAAMMDVIGDAEARVQRALPGLAAVPVQMWLVSHRALRTNRRLRVVSDVIYEELLAQLTESRPA